MNAQQTPAYRRPRITTLFVTFLLAAAVACTGGGGGDGSPTFTLQSVTPNESVDVNGGDKVIVRGTNFIAARVAKVFFGAGNIGFGVTVLSDTEIEVTVPPAPSGNAGTYSIEVETLNYGTKGLFRAFTYLGGGGYVGPPVPQTIFPTSFTATGAEGFTIGGTNLGPANGEVTVNFVGVGTVKATVSSDGQFATGNAPISAGVPPATPVQVTVDADGTAVAVPTQVSYTYLAPSSVLLPYQEGSGNASRPVRVAAGLAVVATSGTDANWGNANGTGNDSLYLITGPPLTTAPPLDLFAAAGLPATQRRLDANNSIPVALDGDTVCLYSPGADGFAVTGDEVLLVVSNLQGATPLVRALPVPFLIPAPVTAVNSTTVAMTTQLTGAAGAQDELRFATVSSGIPTLSTNRVDIGLADNVGLAGRTSRSIPFTPDGDTVFVFTLNPGGGARAFSDSNDLLTSYKLSTGATAKTPAQFLHDTPIALSATRVVAAAKSVASPPDPDDKLVIYDLSGGSFTTTYMGVGSIIQALGLRTIVPLGNGHVALSHGGPNFTAGNADDQIAVFRDDGSGTLTQLNVGLAGRPLLTPLGDGSVIAFGPGPDLASGTFDDRSVLLRADGSSFAEFPGAPLWGQGTLAGVEQTRALVVGAGTDGVYGTGNEELIVFQSKSLGVGVATSRLPMSGPLGHAVFAAPGQAAQARTPFVPVGPGWGLMQSPGGVGGAFLRPNNVLLIVNY